MVIWEDRYFCNVLLSLSFYTFGIFTVLKIPILPFVLVVCQFFYFWYDVSFVSPKFFILSVQLFLGLSFLLFVRFAISRSIFPSCVMMLSRFSKVDLLSKVCQLISIVLSSPFSILLFIIVLYLLFYCLTLIFFCPTFYYIFHLLKAIRY